MINDAREKRSGTATASIAATGASHSAVDESPTQAICAPSSATKLRREGSRPNAMPWWTSTGTPTLSSTDLPVNIRTIAWLAKPSPELPSNSSRHSAAITM